MICENKSSTNLTMHQHGAQQPFPINSATEKLFRPAAASFILHCMISVVIPTHNAQTTLPRCFDSLIGATVRGVVREVIVADVIRLLDGPLAPFGDAAQLAERIRTEERHAGLFELFLDVRNAASAILDHTTLSALLERDRRILAARRRKDRSHE